MASTYKVYGVPLSQPFRAVVWTLLQKHMSFEIVMAVPGAKTRMGTRHENFRNLVDGRTTSVPVMEDGQNVLVESPAILSYLCHKHNWTDLYPTTMSSSSSSSDDNDDELNYKRAHIDGYMHWHHGNTRQLAGMARRYLRPDLVFPAEEQETQYDVVLDQFQAWLPDDGNDVFIGGGTSPSIADILAYEEFVQNTMTKLLTVDQYKKIRKWMDRMEELPYHDEAHAALTTLGSLKDDYDSAKDVQKKLGPATKAGLQAIAEAQKSYTSSL